MKIQDYLGMKQWLKSGAAEVMATGHGKRKQKRNVKLTVQITKPSESLNVGGMQYTRKLVGIYTRGRESERVEKGRGERKDRNKKKPKQKQNQKENGSALAPEVRRTTA